MTVTLESYDNGSFSTAYWGGTASAGDLLMIIAGSVNHLDSPSTPPSGWTELYDEQMDPSGEQDAFFIWYLIAAGGETSAVIDAGSSNLCWVGLRFSGVDGLSLIHI